MTSRNIQPPRGRMIDLGLWALTVALGVVTMVFSFAFSPPGGEGFLLADKFGHGIMYFATFFCLLLAAVWRPGRGNGPFPSRGLWLALAVIATGLAIEVLQEIATVDRHAQIGDVLSEITGAFGALAIHAWMRRRSSVRAARTLANRG